LLQSQALSFLQKQPNAKMTDLANYLKLSSSSTTQLIERMVHSGYVARINDEHDRRVVHISVTKQGLEKLQQMKEEKRNNMKKLFSKIEKKDVIELIRIQEKILHNLQNNS